VEFDDSESAEQARASGLLVGVAVALAGLVVGLSIAFATGTQTEQYAAEADAVQGSERLLTIGSLTRSNLGVVLVLARSDANGIEVPDLDQAIEELEGTIDALGLALEEWSNLGVDPDQATIAFDKTVSALESTISALRFQQLERAESLTVQQVLPGLDQMNATVILERDNAAARQSALRSSAGSIARIASLGVALIIPGIAFFMFRGAMRRRQRQEQLQTELRQERELVKTKDEFIANLSHELRTPLTGVYGFAMMMDDMLTPPRDPDLDIIRDTTRLILGESGELKRMVEDLLVAAKHEHGMLNLVFEDVEVDEVVTMTLEVFRRQNAGLTLDLEPATLTTDRHHVGQVVRNLVSNAVKHGGPEILVEGRIEPDAYVIRVVDDGDGVPPELAERLFTRFVHQGDTPLLTGSVGLGLFISHNLAQAMGGDLTYSRLQGLTMFTFALPLELAQWEEGPAEAA
jgi:signal transduction histidine kinase